MQISLPIPIERSLVLHARKFGISPHDLLRNFLFEAIRNPAGATLNLDLVLDSDEALQQEIPFNAGHADKHGNLPGRGEPERDVTELPPDDPAMMRCAVERCLDMAQPIQADPGHEGITAECNDALGHCWRELA